MQLKKNCQFIVMSYELIMNQWLKDNTLHNNEYTTSIIMLNDYIFILHVRDSNILHKLYNKLFNMYFTIYHTVEINTFILLLKCKV